MRTVAVTFLLLLSGAGVGRAEPSFVIQGDTRMGTFAVKADGSLAGAIRAFGAPRLRRTGEGCFATWPQYGLVMNFYNLGGKDPCKPKFGRFSKAVAHGSRWRTNKGAPDRTAEYRDPPALPARDLPQGPSLLLAVELVADHPKPDRGRTGLLPRAPRRDRARKGHFAAGPVPGRRRLSH
ncbi:MAG TPA: hypothetical protein VF872_02185 [Gaiellaceae bacterium]